MAVHTKGKNKRTSYGHPPRETQGFKKSKKDFSNYECFTCHNMGHIDINFPMKAERVKKKKRFQAHAAEDNDQEDEKRTKENEDSCEEYVLISVLIGSLSPRNGTF